MTPSEQQLEPWLRAFAEASPDAALAFDRSGRIVLANPRAANVFGEAADELVGSSIRRLFPGPALLEDEAAASSGFIVARAGRRGGSETETFPAEVSLTPIHSKPPLYLVFVRDVSDDRKVERERIELLASERVARSEAERLNLLKDEFLATLSHELRTPLNAMLGWTQVLRRFEADRQLHARAVDTIERNIRVQCEMIEDLLDMSRIVSGKLRLEPSLISLESVIDGALEVVSMAAQNKGIPLTRELDPEVGPVMGDPRRLQQIVWNLLSNAVKFTPRGGQVRVRLQQVGAFARIDVTDSGAGIGPEFMPHLFDRFRQADVSTTRSHGGLGLGLSIVKSLVEMHGGTVRAESAGKGRGSTFIVVVPVSRTPSH